MVDIKLDYGKMMELCESKPEFRAKTEIVGGVSVTIFSYMVAMTNTFDSELAKEFRGTTFRTDTKECICRPFPKFFNLGERPETQEHLIDWKNAKFFTKHDGSMATPVIINDKIFWKTKNSFYSDVAVKIQKFWENSTHEGTSFFSSRKALLHCLSRCNYTPIFEYVAPHNQIVLPYETEELRYLGFREIDAGRFWPYGGGEEYVTKDEIFGLEGIEGFVVHTDDQMFKMKTKWYIDRHKICTTFNPKTIIQASLDETIDDLIGVAGQLGLTEQKERMEALRDETLEMRIEIQTQINLAWGLVGFIEDKKEFALAVQKTLHRRWWHFMFAIKNGKDTTSMLHERVFYIVYYKFKPNKEITDV